MALLALGITSIVSPASAGKIKAGKLPLDGVCTIGQSAIWDGTKWVCSDVAAAIPGAAGPKVVFVTSGDFLGDLNGLEGADELCQAAAVAGDVPPGFYVAWLSTSAVDAIERLTPGVSGYFLPSGIKVADDIADLTDATIDHVIDEDEFGVVVGSVGVWTGTSADGSLVGASFTCNDWSVGTRGANGGIGASFEVDLRWTDLDNRTCDISGLRLYCFQK